LLNDNALPSCFLKNKFLLASFAPGQATRRERPQLLAPYSGFFRSLSSIYDICAPRIVDEREPVAGQRIGREGPVDLDAAGFELLEELAAGPARQMATPLDARWLTGKGKTVRLID